MSNLGLNHTRKYVSQGNTQDRSVGSSFNPHDPRLTFVELWWAIDITCHYKKKKVPENGQTVASVK